jgi:hypothetical protein
MFTPLRLRGTKQRPALRSLQKCFFTSKGSRSLSQRFGVYSLFFEGKTSLSPLILAQFRSNPVAIDPRIFTRAAVGCFCLLTPDYCLLTFVSFPDQDLFKSARCRSRLESPSTIEA